MIQKQQIIEDFGRDAKDTGSPEAQVAILTARIQSLTEHFKKHKQDYHGQRGLTKIVGKRRSLLQYLKRKNTDRYLNLVKRLGIRR